MRKIIGLTDAGAAKLEQHLLESSNQALIPFAKATSNLIEVVTPQVNNPNPGLSVEPWYFSMGVAGTTYPASADEHETSDYDWVCEAYNEADFQIEHAPLVDEDVCCVIRVDGIELVRGSLKWTHDLFEHIASQPGAPGYDLAGIEKLLGRPFMPKPKQKVEYLDESGRLLISGIVPEPDPARPKGYWPLSALPPIEEARSMADTILANHKIQIQFASPAPSQAKEE
ncbi:hypothetical protein ACN99C_26750 (plasmid) [Pseudomonas alloputida]|uniref:hypothetical protein n=1 Tax=Pseudomonas alloputida TaxID=1940621 RepID=UPI003B428ABB